MLSLSDIPGRFLVGATTFVTPVRSPRVIGSLKLRNKTSNALQPALYLEEVAYTAYYPAAVSPKTAKKGLDWLIRWAMILVLQITFLYTSNQASKGIFTWFCEVYKYAQPCFFPYGCHCLNLDTAIPSWVLWPVVYFFGALIKVINSPITSFAQTISFLNHRSPSIPTHPFYIPLK